MTVERLDFSKPPPRYAIWEDDGDRREDDMPFAHDCVGWYFGPVDDDEEWHDEPFESENDALAAAWAHHKARHDPPGIEVFSDDGAEEHWCFAARDTAALCDSPHGSRNGARAAAWALYENALDVADLLDAENGPAETWPERCAWPRPLTWTAEQRVEVRRWLVDSTAELPEVLRG